jgi:hypothetical protein
MKTNLIPLKLSCSFGVPPLGEASRKNSARGRARFGSPRQVVLSLLAALFVASTARADLTIDASNSPYTINQANSPVTGLITVAADGVLSIEDGAQIVPDDFGTVGLVVYGTLNMAGGSVSTTIFNGTTMVDVEGGTVSITGGSISGGNHGWCSMADP